MTVWNGAALSGGQKKMAEEWLLFGRVIQAVLLRS